MIFENRREAGKLLAEKLSHYKTDNPLILALPRGGVPVGYEIAKHLNASMDVVVTRKLGAPNNFELGIGAIAPGVLVLDQTEIKTLRINKIQIEEVKGREQQELERRIKEYRGNKPPPALQNRTVILVDDGLATGITMQAAIKYVLKCLPGRLIVAVPICARDSATIILTQLRLPQDELVCLASLFNLSAISQWYKCFPQVTDQEVINLLRESNQ